MDRAQSKDHELADGPADHAAESAVAKKASPASLLDQAASLWTQITGGSAKAVAQPASPTLGAALAAMSVDIARLPDPTDHSIDWSKDPTAADFSRARELYLQAFALRDTHDRARLAPILTNLMRALTRASAQESRWQGDGRRLLPLAEQAYRALASGT